MGKVFIVTVQSLYPSGKNPRYHWIRADESHSQSEYGDGAKNLDRIDTTSSH
jgi:hypothetical protein